MNQITVEEDCIPIQTLHGKVYVRDGKVYRPNGMWGLSFVCYEHAIKYL
jgi:hypothetical protein